MIISTKKRKIKKIVEHTKNIKYTEDIVSIFFNRINNSISKSLIKVLKLEIQDTYNEMLKIIKTLNGKYNLSRMKPIE